VGRGGWGGEGGAEDGFGGAVVGGGVEGGDTGGEGAVDEQSGREGEGVGVVLVVEGCGAEDERGEDGGERRLGLRHCEDRECLIEDR